MQAGLAFYVNDLTGTESQWLFDIQYVVTDRLQIWQDIMHGTPSNCYTHHVEVILVYGNGVGEFFTEVVGKRALPTATSPMEVCVCMCMWLVRGLHVV